MPNESGYDYGQLLCSQSTPCAQKKGERNQKKEDLWEDVSGVPYSSSIATFVLYCFPQISTWNKATEYY